MLLASLSAEALKELAPTIDRWMADQDDEIDRLQRENRRLKRTKGAES